MKKDKKLKNISFTNFQKYYIITPFSPTIYQMKYNYEEQCKKKEREKKDDDQKDQNNDQSTDSKDLKKELFDVEKEICMNRVNINDKDLSKIYRLMGFKILNNFALTILKKTHPAKKVERIVEKVINQILF